jgi:hypothetical protein
MKTRAGMQRKRQELKLFFANLCAFASLREKFLN